VQDFNGDGKPDILLFGNHSDNRLKLGSIDANYGCLLVNNDNDTFSYVPQTVSGLSVVGDVKSAVEIKIGGVNYLIVATADKPLEFYKINQ